MACSKEYNNKDLAECGICLMVMEEPKALPCLHSYCLKCLSKWAEGRTDVVKCPICMQDFEIPSEGVTGFVTNFFINTLKDRREIADKLYAKDARIPCSCCVATNCKAEAYCTDCNGFICEECGNMHRRVRLMQNHKTKAFDDLQSGKVDIKTLMKQECCKEHKGQVLRFYCNTCGILICHECSIVDHPVAYHDLVNLKTASKDQRLEIRQLSVNCTQSSNSVVEYLANAEKIQNNLERNLKKAKSDLHKAAEAIRVKVLADIQQKETELEAKLSNAAAENMKQLDAQKDNLQLKQTRLYTALQMASEVTETGSDYDLALVYFSLKSSLTQLKDLKPKGVDGNLGDIKFILNQSTFPAMPSLGSLSLGRDLGRASSLTKVKGASAAMPSLGSLCLGNEQTYVPPMAKIKKKKYGVGVWKMEMQFGKDRVQNGLGIALTPAGDVMVTDDFGNTHMTHAFCQTGKPKFDIKTKQGLKPKECSNPWNVVTSPDGRIFITHRVSHVNVYDTNGALKYKFLTYSPSNVSYDYTRLWGLAIDNQGYILVGECDQKYISKHSLDGSHISSFNVTIQPRYIAVTPQDHIVVSSGSNDGVQILDSTGNILHSLNPPAGVFLWNPYGICCTSGNDIYIANLERANGGGIYCYSVSGQYKGCITKEVYCPRDLVLNDDEDKLYVVECQCVKIFNKL